MSEYPKITQEALTDAAKVILSALKNPQYITGAPYSSLMVKTINEVNEATMRGYTNFIGFGLNG